MSELDQFCILAQSQKGRACAALIEQVVSCSRGCIVLSLLLGFE